MAVNHHPISHQPEGHGRLLNPSIPFLYTPKEDINCLLSKLWWGLEPKLYHSPSQEILQTLESQVDMLWEDKYGTASQNLPGIHIKITIQTGKANRDRWAKKPKSLGEHQPAEDFRSASHRNYVSSLGHLGHYREDAGSGLTKPDTLYLITLPSHSHLHSQEHTRRAQNYIWYHKKKAQK